MRRVSIGSRRRAVAVGGKGSSWPFRETLTEGSRDLRFYLLQFLLGHAPAFRSLYHVVEEDLPLAACAPRRDCLASNGALHLRAALTRRVGVGTTDQKVVANQRSDIGGSVR